MSEVWLSIWRIHRMEMYGPLVAGEKATIDTLLWAQGQNASAFLHECNARGRWGNLVLTRGRLVRHDRFRAYPRATRAPRFPLCRLAHALANPNTP
jgi:hypothetical protein